MNARKTFALSVAGRFLDRINKIDRIKGVREDEEVRFLFHHILCRVLLRIGNLVLVGVAVDG